MEIKKEVIKKFYKFLRHEGISELRPIRPRWHKDSDKNPPSFFINSFEQLIKELENLDDDWNVYIGINARQTKGKADSDVKFIENVGHDIDAHGEEGKKENALEISKQMLKDAVNQGYEEPLFIDSGRGYWILHHISPIENNEENRKKVKLFGDTICEKYQTKGIQMDGTVYNPSRIMRVPGTKNVSNKDNYVWSEILNEPKGFSDSKLSEKIINLEPKKYEYSIKPTENKKDKSSFDNFMHYCLVNKLPKGEINRVISKNVAIWLFEHPERERLEELYLQTQEGSPNELKNWFKQIKENGTNKYKYGIGELVNFTKKYKIPFSWKENPEYKQWLKEKKAEEKIKKEVKKEEDAIKFCKAITFFTNKIDLAEKFIKVQPLFYDKSKLWWVWNFKEYRWEMCDEVDIMNEISKNTPADTVTSKERTEILESLKQVSRLNSPKPMKNTWIQFREKIIDIETGEKFNATPDFFITNPIPHSLGDNEETPNMDRIFEEWVGKNFVQTLYEILAYCLIPNYPIHRIFCFIGEGMNGKSKYLELLRNFIGNDNCCSTELDTLLNSRFEITRLHKKLVCQMGETNFNEMNKTSILKKLSGGDLIGFEYKNKNPFEEKNYAKIIIATNNLPTTSDKTIGFYRRWSIIDFPNQFTEAKDILGEIPEEEYNALALKSINILTNLLKNRKFHNEGSIEERKEKYESKSNFLETFIQTYTEQDSSSYITKADFYKKFSSWSKENRHREMSETSIGRSMKKLGMESEKRYFNWLYDGKGGQARVWSGMKWKE